MTDEELIARLRKGETPMANHYMDEAADRIEALTAENTKLHDHIEGVAKNTHKIMVGYEAKLAKALEALLWCSGSADFNEGGVAREGWLKVCAPLLKGESHE